MKDWFRRSTWSASDKEEFEARLRRARPAGRAQYLRIQAVYLSETGRDDLVPPAIELLDRLLAEYPDSMQVALAEQLRARCYERMGDALLAVDPDGSLGLRRKRVPEKDHFTDQISARISP